jgi:hypothetical protein
MIEDKELGLKIAESPEEALLTHAVKSAEDRIRQEELGLELDRVVLEYLKKKQKKNNTPLFS